MSLDKKTQNLILKQLRNLTRKWHIKNEVLKESKVKVKIGYFKNGNRKYKVLHRCAHCEGLHDVVDVDHIEEVGRFLGDFDDYISRLFCSKDNLQVLCKPCHAIKTAEFAADRASGVDLL